MDCKMDSSNNNAIHLTIQQKKHKRLTGGGGDFEACYNDDF